MTAGAHRTYVLVHGAWHSGECWERLVPLIATEGHEVLTPSLTGHGQTQDQMGPEVGLDTYVADVVQLFLDRDLSDVVLVGHSFAGMIISLVANRLLAVSPIWSTSTPWTRSMVRPALTSCRRLKACSTRPPHPPSRGESLHCLLSSSAW